MTIKQKQNLNTGNFLKKDRRGRGKEKSWWPIVNAVMYVFIFIGGIYFLASINDLSIKGFKLAELKAEATALYNENEDLELRIMRLEAYENLTARAEEIRMVKVDKIDYISVINGEVAKK